MLCRFIQKHCIQDARIRIDNGSKKQFDKNKNLLKLPIFLNTGDYGRAQLVLRVADLGKVAQGGLKQVAASLGIEMEEKSLMDDYKSQMIIPYKDKKLRDYFIRYAKADATILFKIREVNQQRTIDLYEAIKQKPKDKEKLTTGSIVAGLFYDWLKAIIDEKDGVTTDTLSGYEYFTKKNGKPYDLCDLLKKCGVSYFAQTNPEYSKQTNAIIQGGRAKNERPSVITDRGVIADADLSSCYATILESLVYPVGLPYTYYTHESSKRKPMTLGKFLKKHEKSLAPRLYTIIVSGKLNHHQTLVHSKITDNFRINEKYNPDDPKIDAEFRLYTKEIINGVITSDILEVLRNVCNTRELASWMNLEVISAVWYPQHKDTLSPALWAGVIKEETENGVPNEVIVEQKSNGKEIIKDNRTRYWVGIPIKDFIQPFKEKRKELKERRNEEPKNTPKWREFDAQQNSMKLVCNTLYGVLASPYFDIGNVVVANNITAAARTAVWCLATAAGTYQSITDGGAYNLNQVRDWHDGAKPSMNTLSLWRNPKRLHRNITSKLFTKPLGSNTLWALTPSEKGSEYSVITNHNETILDAKEEGWEYLDQALLDHIKHFFRKSDDSPSRITILDLITFSHKDVYKEIVLHSQTNYQFIHVCGERKSKARGYKLDGYRYDDDTNKSNILNLFTDLRLQPDNIPAYPPQTIPQILKCNQANEMLMAKKSNILQQRGLIAGDSILNTKWVRPISLSMFHWKTHEQYQSWERKSKRIKDKYGYGIEQFFLTEEMNVDYERAIKTIQNRIDDGFMWVVGEGKKSGNTEHRFINHPYAS